MSDNQFSSKLNLNFNKNVITKNLDLKIKSAIDSLYPDIPTIEKKKEDNSSTTFTNENYFKNNILFNKNHSRFNIDNDPWIFTRDKLNPWPSYVEFIFYTLIDDKYVQLSRSTQLYLNKCFSVQNFACFIEIGISKIQDFITKKKDAITSKNIIEEYVNSYTINDPKKINIFYKNEDEIKTGENTTTLLITKRHIYETPLSEWRFKDYFDYIPICFIASRISMKSFYNYDKVICSTICFHNSQCHNNWCKDHYPINTYNKSNYLFEHCNEMNPNIDYISIADLISEHEKYII